MIGVFDARPVKWAGVTPGDEALDGVPRDEFSITKWGRDANGKSFPAEWKVKSGPNKGAEVNVDLLNDNFNDGDEVTAEALVEKHLIKDFAGGIKVLGRGEITKKLTIQANAVSATAREKIEAAGGTAEVIS